MRQKVIIPEPISAGVILSYKCTSRCRHCMYACSPKWKADWISEKNLEKTLTYLAGKIQPSPYGPEGIGLNHGLHLTGGEPFLNFDLLLKAVRMAEELGIPSTFVETNSFWCDDDSSIKNMLMALRAAGLKGLLISVNPFITEEVPFERTERAARIGQEIFGRSCLIYQEYFYYQFRSFGIKGKLSFEEYLIKGREGLGYVELIPMGRAAYELGRLFRKYPARVFFGKSCRDELLSPWHVHLDNYGNYMTGFCGGISISRLDRLSSGEQEIDLGEYSILETLLTDIKNLYELATHEYGYQPKEQGYVSKCHLCIDMRRHLTIKTNQFKELLPKDLYLHL